ncbi:MAG: hypothetical protein GX616_02730 [Planctomycetes bacterium]|nr:hypothetical protein [Planctomycetota bacterium]
MNNLMHASVMVVVVLLTGCASFREMKTQRDVLAARLTVTEDRVQSLEKDKAGLQRQVDHLSGMTNVLEREKTERIKETTDVRGEVRGYIRDQVENLREFSQARQLMDYIGSEILERAAIEGEGVLLLDVKHRLPADAILLGARLFARAPTRVAVCIARPHDKGYIVVWRSNDFPVEASGAIDLTFDTPIAAQMGDLIGLYTASTVQVPSDIATGDVRPVRLNPAPGKLIEKHALPRNTGRTCSFGVVGFLE